MHEKLKDEFNGIKIKQAADDFAAFGNNEATNVP